MFYLQVQKIRNLLDRVKDIKIPTVTCIEVARYDAETGRKSLWVDERCYLATKKQESLPHHVQVADMVEVGLHRT